MQCEAEFQWLILNYKYIVDHKNAICSNNILHWMFLRRVPPVRWKLSVNELTYQSIFISTSIWRTPWTILQVQSGIDLWLYDWWHIRSFRLAFICVHAHNDITAQGTNLYVIKWEHAIVNNYSIRQEEGRADISKNFVIWARHKGIVDTLWNSCMHPWLNAWWNSVHYLWNFMCSFIFAF